MTEDIRSFQNKTTYTSDKPLEDILFLVDARHAALTN